MRRVCVGLCVRKITALPLWCGRPTGMDRLETIIIIIHEKHGKYQNSAMEYFVLAEYGVKINYIRGRDNIRADFLSRLRPSIDVNIIDAQVSRDIPEPMDIEHAGLDLLRFDEIPGPELKHHQQVEFDAEMTESLLGQSDYIMLGGILCSTKLPHTRAEERPRVMLPGI